MNSIHQKIGLQGARFFAYHGFYPIEQILGSEFIVDIEVELDVSNWNHDDLAQTVNYEQLYQIVSSEMKKTSKLIETLAHAILKRVEGEFSAIKTIRIIVRKIHPSVCGEVNNSFVELISNR
ncbi:MAG: dihydroneopterin aldolase [Pedobacter sp.]|nr:MAG: dihydroneopterin aldolase [Pedobacter sp.]